MKYIKKGLFIIAVAAISIPLYAQDTEEAKKDDGSPKQAQLVDDTLNDFEYSEDWRAFSTSPLGETETKKVLQQGEIKDVFGATELTAEEKERFKPGVNHVMGVKTWFNDRGFDRVEVKPPHEYIIKGIGREVSIWVLGRNFRHTFYVKLRDYRGNTHTVRMGRLDFLGWKKLTATIPGWIPQSTRYSLMDRNLHFVSFFVVSDKHEIPGKFYFYVDDLKMKVDKTDTDYPGSQIKDTW